METIRDMMKNKDTRVIAQIMFNETNGKPPKILYRVLGCVLYSILKNYVCIDYISCQSKTLSRISYNMIFEQPSLNILLGIGNPEVLLNLVYCHGFT